MSRVYPSLLNLIIPGRNPRDDSHGHDLDLDPLTVETKERVVINYQPNSMGMYGVYGVLIYPVTNKSNVTKR